MLTLANNASHIVQRRLLIALGISLLLHVLALSKPGTFSRAEKGAAYERLEISLRAPEAIHPAPTQPQAASVPAVVPSAQEIKVPRKPEKLFSTPAVPARPSEPTPAVSTTATSPSLPRKEPGKTDQTPGIPLPGLIGPVQRVAIEFEIFSGADRQLMGTARQLYVSDSSEHYGLSIEQTLRADNAAGAEPWQLEISGTVTRQGLSPTLFKMRGGVPERLMALKEVPENSSETPIKPRSGRIPDGILDRQSLLYQFMQQPPLLGGGKLWLTDGATHRLYNYRLAGIDSFVIPSLGGVRTLKVVLSSGESPETIELWLIPDLHYLPAKLRHTDRNGVITEQLVTSLEFK